MSSPVLGAKTYREIISQPAVWRTVPSVLPNGQRVMRAFDPWPEAILFTGCGSSYYLAQAAAAVFHTVMAIIPSSAVPASELLLFPELALPAERRPLVVAISRSGLTSEVLAAAGLARQRGLHVLSIVCDPASPLARQSDHVIAFPAAQEESMVMTRSFTTMLLSLQRCAGLLAGATAYLDALEAVPAAGARLVSATPSVSWPWRELVVLGGGPLFGVAQEAAMKVREASLTPAIAYHPLEFRHGPMAVVDEQTLVLLLASDRARAEEAALVSDIRALGARVLVLAEQAAGLDADTIIELRSGVAENARQALYLLPVHLLAYQRALARGTDPDAPRHLSRAVVLNDLPLHPAGELRQQLP